jgi:polysaccharide biosynthesis/export protein
MMKVFLESVQKILILSAVFALSASIGAAQAQQNTTKPNDAKNDPPAATQPVRTTAAPVSPGEYVIGASDVLEIDVWKEKELTEEVPVRPDGKITMPLIGEIQASGMTPIKLQDFISDQLKAYLENPQVTVIVKAPVSHEFNIVGEVARPGAYPLSQSTTVLDALAAAGGFQTFAKKTKIYVLRPMPGGIRVRILFNYKDVIMGRNLSENVLLKPGDTIVVP